MGVYSISLIATEEKSQPRILHLLSSKLSESGWADDLLHRAKGMYAYPAAT